MALTAPWKLGEVCQPLPSPGLHRTAVSGGQAGISSRNVQWTEVGQVQILEAKAMFSVKSL